MKKLNILVCVFLASLVVSCTKKDMSSKSEISEAAVTNIGLAHHTTSVSRESTLLVTTLAGSKTMAGDQDGEGANALFYQIYDITKDDTGNLYVTDQRNYAIKRITPSGTVTTVFRAANDFGYETLGGIVLDGLGNILYSDEPWKHIRKVDANRVVTTFAGTTGTGGNADGPGTQAQFWFPSRMVKDPEGNIYVLDFNSIRKITPSGEVSTFVGGGPRDLNGNSLDGKGTKASFKSPKGITIDKKGNLFVTEQGKVRKVAHNGVVTTVAGGNLLGDVDGQGANARFHYTGGIAVDQSGNLYVVDEGNFKVKKVTPTGQVTTIAGVAQWVQHPVDGTAETARFAAPRGITIDASGQILYVVDGHTVRMITGF